MGSSLVPWVEVGRVGPGGELVVGLPLGTSVVYTRPAGQVGFCGLRNSRGRGDGSWERLGDAGRQAGESRGCATRLSFPPANAARRPGNPRAVSCAAGLPLSAWLGFVRGCCLSWPPGHQFHLPVHSQPEACTPLSPEDTCLRGRLAGLAGRASRSSISRAFPQKPVSGRICSRRSGSREGRGGVSLRVTARCPIGWRGCAGAGQGLVSRLPPQGHCRGDTSGPRQVRKRSGSDTQAGAVSLGFQVPQDGTREEPAFLTWCSQEEASVPEQPASCRRRAHPGAVSLRGGGSFAQGPVWLRSGPEPLHLGLLTGCLTCHVGRTCGPQR